MAKMTLLEMVQSILSDGDADEIDSISDIPEGTQVALIIRDVYFQMLNMEGVPELTNAFFNLEGLGDTTRPTYLQLPDDVTEVLWWKYNAIESGGTQADWQDVTYCDTKTFFEKLNGRDLSETNVVEFNSTDGVPLRVFNDQAPEFYTIVQDKFIVCDAYDAAVDASLQGSKTTAAGLEEPTFTVSDSFTPSLDSNLFPYLLAEAKATALATVLKQQQNRKIEQQAREQKIRNQSQRHRFRHKNKRTTQTEGVNYGRSPRNTVRFPREDFNPS